MASSNPYFDDAGNPTLHDSVVLFLDLLGTRGLRTQAEAQAHLSATYAAVAAAKAEIDPPAVAATAGANRWFSDNLGLSYAIQGAWDDTTALGYMITETGWLQLDLAISGFFSRGAIARGPYFTDQTFIHGPALDRAVELEKNRAIAPRVVLDEASIATANKGLREDPGENSPWRSQLLIDGDGVVFIDYLGAVYDDIDDADLAPEPIDAHRDLIQQRIFDFDGVRGIEEKYRWLAKYHNSFIERHAPALVAVGAKPDQLTISCAQAAGDFKPFGFDFPAPASLDF